MQKKRKQAIGYSLIILGIIIIFLKPITSITGMSIASSLSIVKDVWFILVGLGMIGIGIILSLDEVVEEIISPKIKPGKGIKGDYVPLKDILRQGTLISNKVNVNVSGGTIYRDGRPIQGLRIVGDKIEFAGYHFTNSDAARIIERDQILEIKNYLDPYIYLLEAMSYSGKSEKEIRHLIGSSSAEEALSMTIKYPIEKIYLKFNKDRPTHYAVEGNVEIEDIVPKKGEYIRRRRIEEL